MHEAFITTFIISFFVIDPFGNAPIVLSVTQHKDGACRARTTLNSTAIATAIILSGLSVHNLVFGLTTSGLIIPLNILTADRPD